MLILLLTWSSLQQKRRYIEGQRHFLPGWVFSLSSLRRSEIPGLDSGGGGPRNALQNCPICPRARPGEEQGQTLSWSLTSCPQVRDVAASLRQDKAGLAAVSCQFLGKEAPCPHSLPQGHPQPSPSQCLGGAISTPQTVALGSPAQADATVGALLCLECGLGARAGSPGPSALSSPPNREWSFPPFPTNTCFAT